MHVCFLAIFPYVFVRGGSLALRNSVASRSEPLYATASLAATLAMTATRRAPLAIKPQAARLRAAFYAPSSRALRG